MAKIKNYDYNTILEIEWIDAFADSDWLSHKEAVERPDVDCFTLGYFTKIDKEFIYVSPSRGKLKTSDRDIIVIPLSTITKIRTLK